MNTQITAELVKKAQLDTDTLERLRALPWEAVQRAGIVFTQAVGNNEITEADMESLIRLTARLLEFVADAREVLTHDPNRISFVS